MNIVIKVWRMEILLALKALLSYVAVNNASAVLAGPILDSMWSKICI